MSTGLKTIWPYVGVLLILAAIAIFSEDYLPSEWLGDANKVVDSTGVKVDSLEVGETIANDSLVADTLPGKTEPSVEEETAIKQATAIKQWRLVVASIPDREGAERMATKMGGEAKVKYVEYLKTYRVVYHSYTGLAAAQSGFEEIRQQYPEAWLVYF